MIVNYTSERKPVRGTSAKPDDWKLTLEAEGSYDEIKWLSEQINMIGREEKKKGLNKTK